MNYDILCYVIYPRNDSNLSVSTNQCQIIFDIRVVVVVVIVDTAAPLTQSRDTLYCVLPEFEMANRKKKIVPYIIILYVYT